MDKPPQDAEGIAEPIATLMRGADVSLNSLALTTRIPYTTLHRRLHEPATLTMGDLLRISAALEVSPAQLLPSGFNAEVA